MNDPTSSRRNFLRGRVSSHTDQLRPPWALAGPAFHAACTRCGDCARKCPTRIIKQGDGGYPTVDFKIGECTFCGECVSACKPAALVKAEPAATPWQIRAAIGENCLARRQVECRVCGEQCGEGAIHFRPQLGGIAQPDIETAKCTGCGACVVPCPTLAIRVA